MSDTLDTYQPQRRTKAPRVLGSVVKHILYWSVSNSRHIEMAIRDLAKKRGVKAQGVK